MKYLPVVGPQIQETLEEAVGDIVANVIHQILEDLASASNHAFIEDIVNVFIPTPDDSAEETPENQAVINLILEILDAVKTQVQVKHWREDLP